MIAAMNAHSQINRRTFLRTSSAFACGLAGTTSLVSSHAAENAPEQGVNILGPRPSYTPQVGTLVSMLTWMRPRSLEPAQGLSVAQLDYLQDKKANTIGALLLHLAATERHYQIHTFEGRKWNDWDEETKRRWNVPVRLGEEARQQIKGNNLSYYLTTLSELREQTLMELRKRDDAWLMKIDPAWPWGPTNNFCKWFHVCEHESHHSGQIVWLKRRLPGAVEPSE